MSITDFKSELQRILTAAQQIRDDVDAILNTTVHHDNDDPAILYPYVDFRARMPMAKNPTDPVAWYVRSDAEIDGITIHHTMSDDPVALARYFIDNKHRPSTEYTFWVTGDGEALWCLDIEQACWHDHTGHRNTHLSIGMSGSLHAHSPPSKQLAGTVRLVAWLMQRYTIPIENVRGHCDYAATICPGWLKAGWRDAFYQALRAEVGGGG